VGGFFVVDVGVLGVSFGVSFVCVFCVIIGVGFGASIVWSALYPALNRSRIILL